MTAVIEDSEAFVCVMCCEVEDEESVVVLLVVPPVMEGATYKGSACV